jgi:hypothetical protein
MKFQMALVVRINVQFIREKNRTNEKVFVLLLLLLLNILLFENENDSIFSYNLYINVLQ